jgi:hypothetical protein
VSPELALEVVNEATRHEGHEFWPLNRDWTIGLKAMAGRLQGHQQWTDAALLWHAAEREGVLVSFDAGIQELAGREFSSLILLLKRS